MLRNTRKRLHQFFRPKNALLQFYLQADHKITEGSERAARISHIRTASARCISPARAGPYEKGPKPASSFRRSTAPTRNSMRVSREAIFRQAYADKFTNAEIRPAGPKTPDFNTKPYQPQYVWLGAGVRAELFAFLDDCRSDKSSKVNVRLAISPGSSTTSWGVASRRRQCHTLACSGNMPRKETRLAAGSVAPGSSHRLLRRASITSSI